MLQELTPEQFEKMNHSEDILILDGRTDEEYEHGHLKGSYLIPVQDLPNRIKEIHEFKDSSVLIYCRSGIRSITAGNFLLEAGFKTVAHLTSGITGWIMAEKKVVL